MIEELVRRINRLENDLNSLIKPEVGRWRTWTPTVSQSAAITITVNHARYMVLSNGLVHVNARITCTSAGTAANAVLVSGLPIAIANGNANAALGIVMYLDSGSQFYIGSMVANAATTMNFRTHAGANFFGINPAVTVANGDVISFQIVYERA